MQKALIAIFLLSSLAVGGYVLFLSDTAIASTKQLPDLKYASTHIGLMRFEAPSELDFAGEEVPMMDKEIAKKLQRELNQKINHTAGTQQLYRRVMRYQNLFTSILKEKGIPEDFFYLSMAESALSNAVSPVGAAGFWQFMPATARSYGLTVNSELDERFDPIKSTYAATRYLTDMHNELGSWTLVAAAYNMGSPRLIRAIKRQNDRSYYYLDLNKETSRYLYRILANKCIVEQPARYGYDLSQITPYAPLRFNQVKVGDDVDDLASFAANYGLTLDQLLTVNPWIKSISPAVFKTLRIQIPLSKDFYAAELKAEHWASPEIETNSEELEDSAPMN
ncbi:MAG: lytic transglycosylase domain-containing protein [Bacteroidia bacterium]|nr:lytic transglycosylase domain-containing protein [Bacteroidia bacterium]